MLWNGYDNTVEAVLLYQFSSDLHYYWLCKVQEELLAEDSCVEVTELVLVRLLTQQLKLLI